MCKILNQGRYSVVQLVTPDLQLLYKYLEEDFNPLLLCKRVVPILDKLQEDKLFSQYVEPLKAIVLVRLIKQVSYYEPQIISASAFEQVLWWRRQVCLCWRVLCSL